MSALVSETGIRSPLPRAAINTKLSGLLLTAAAGTGVFLSGFVIREPAPYELFLAAVMGLWVLLALALPRTILPLLALIIAFNIGGAIAMTQLGELYETPLYLAVTLFLGLTSVFFASITAKRWKLLSTMFNAWALAAVLTSLAGIVGYFALLPGAEAFTRYGRAAGVFEDPNVFGPFLVLPAIWLMHRVLTGKPGAIVAALPALGIILLGIFLSFSRGAWGMFALCAVLLVVALGIQHRSGRFRLRLVILALGALALLAIFLMAVLQIPEVGSLFAERAQLVQEYDAGRYGRFARFGIGVQMAMEHPLGIGALEFGRLWGEDTHNIWLKALLDYSWLGFTAFLTLTCWTLAAGFKILFRPRPWQPFLLCAWIVFVGHIALATVIDIDHWRHFYLLVGIVWGCFALESRYQLAARAAPAPSVNPVDRWGELPIVRAGSERSAAR